MENITIHNYESWFIDYIEGNLDADSMAALTLFLKDHPELKLELEEFDNLSLTPTSVQFQDKNQLRKDERALSNPHMNLSTFTTNDFIAYHEGDLSDIEKKQVLTFIEKNKAAKIEFDQLAEVYLQPTEVIFKNKDILYKKGGVIIPLFVRYAVAASILLMISLFYFTDNTGVDVRVADDHSQETIESTEEKSEPKLMKTQEDGLEMNKSIASEKVVPTENLEQIKRDNPTITSNKLAQVPTAKSRTGSENKSTQNREVITLRAKTVAEIPHNFTSSQMVAALRGLPEVVNNSMADNSTVAVETTTTMTLMEYTEQQVAQKVIGSEGNKLRVFDVLKKIGDKSKLYRLQEESNHKFSLKIAKVKIEGKRGKIDV